MSECKQCGATPLLDDEEAKYDGLCADCWEEEQEDIKDMGDWE